MTKMRFQLIFHIYGCPQLSPLQRSSWNVLPEQPTNQPSQMVGLLLGVISAVGLGTDVTM